MQLLITLLRTILELCTHSSDPQTWLPYHAPVNFWQMPSSVWSRGIWLLACLILLSYWNCELTRLLRGCDRWVGGSAGSYLICVHPACHPSSLHKMSTYTRNVGIMWKDHRHERGSRWDRNSIHCTLSVIRMNPGYPPPQGLCRSTNTWVTSTYLEVPVFNLTSAL